MGILCPDRTNNPSICSSGSEPFCQRTHLPLGTELEDVGSSRTPGWGQQGQNLLWHIVGPTCCFVWERGVVGLCSYGWHRCFTLPLVMGCIGSAPASPEVRLPRFHPSHSDARHIWGSERLRGESWMTQLEVLPSLRAILAASIVIPFPSHSARDSSIMLASQGSQVRGIPQRPLSFRKLFGGDDPSVPRYLPNSSRKQFGKKHNNWMIFNIDMQTEILITKFVEHHYSCGFVERDVIIDETFQIGDIFISKIENEEHWYINPENQHIAV